MEQKAYANMIVDSAPARLQHTLARYVSQRNEDATSIDRFNSIMLANVDVQEVRDTTKLFMKHRLMGD